MPATPESAYSGRPFPRDALPFPSLDPNYCYFFEFSEKREALHGFDAPYLRLSIALSFSLSFFYSLFSRRSPLRRLFLPFSMDRLGSPEPRFCRESPTTNNTEAPAEWRGLLCCGKKPLWEGWMRLDRVLTIAKPLIARNTAGQEPAGKISFSTFCANSVQFP